MGNEPVQEKTCEAKMETLKGRVDGLCVNVEKLENGFAEHKQEIKINVIKYQNRVILLLLGVVLVLLGAILTGILTGSIGVNIKVTSWLGRFFTYVSTLL